MSASSYKRATKRFAARIDHTDGDVSEGFVLVPIGTDFAGYLTQSLSFVHFQMESGEETYLNMQAIKRVTERVERNAEMAEKEAKARRDADRKAKAEAERKAQEEKARAEADRKARQKSSPYRNKEEFEALDILGLPETATLDDLQSTYRRLVKLYHPDRLRGLGIADKKIEYAAEKLADINNAYRLLCKVAKVA